MSSRFCFVGKGFSGMNLSSMCIHCNKVDAEGYAPTYYVTTPNRLCRYCRTLVETKYLQSADNLLVDRLVEVVNHYCAYRFELYLRAGFGFGTFEQFSEGLFSKVYLTPLSRDTEKGKRNHTYRFGSTVLTYYISSGFFIYLRNCYDEMVKAFPSVLVLTE